jgi:plasmid stability protein
MAQLLVRRLDEDLKAALQHRAKAHGRSTEEEVRDILRNAVLKDKAASAPLGTAISVRFSKLGLQADIPELRGNKVRPANLK